MPLLEEMPCPASVPTTIGASGLTFIQAISLVSSSQTTFWHINVSIKSHAAAPPNPPGSLFWGRNRASQVSYRRAGIYPRPKTLFVASWRPRQQAGRKALKSRRRVPATRSSRQVNSTALVNPMWRPNHCLVRSSIEEKKA